MVTIEEGSLATSAGFKASAVKAQRAVHCYPLLERIVMRMHEVKWNRKQTQQKRMSLTECHRLVKVSQTVEGVTHTTTQLNCEQLSTM